MNRRRAWLAVVAVAALVLGACGDSDDTSSTARNGDALVGLFRITPGACSEAGTTGSYFKMVQPNGTVEAGPYVSNPDSTCANHEVSPLSPGTDGGLRSGDYQPQPDPNFTADGGSTSAAVIQPAVFFAVPFGISTNESDPQTSNDVPAPSVAFDGTTLTGDLSAISVSWNGQHFNQGAPKPSAAAAGAVTGTYDAATGAYTLDWTSLIEGGPFNGFTGVWHFEGTFEAT